MKKLVVALVGVWLGVVSPSSDAHEKKDPSEIDKQRETLLKVLPDTDKPVKERAAALGAVQRLWNQEVREAVIELLKDGEADLRKLAIDTLVRNVPAGDREVHETFVLVLNDEKPVVRRAVYAAIARIAAPGAADTLVNAFQFSDGKDKDLHESLVRAIEALGKPAMDKLLALADSGDGKDLDRCVEAFLVLRTRPAADALPALFKNYHVTPIQKAKLFRSYQKYRLDPPVSLEPLVTYLSTLPLLKDGESLPAKERATELPGHVAMRVAAADVLSSAGATASAKTKDLLLTWLDETSPDIRRAVIKTIGATSTRKAVPRLVKLLEQAGTVEENVVVVKALGALQDKSGIPILKQYLNTKDAAPAVRAAALGALGAIDVAAAQPFATAALDSSNEALQKEAVIVLGVVPAGAGEMGHLYLDKKLPHAVLPQVADAIRRHADKSAEHARLLSDVMRGGLLVSPDSKERENINALVKAGNVQRGRELFLGHKGLRCFACHRLEGGGGNVGPDLTRLWETQALEKVIEAIVEPSKEIKDGYQSYLATTKQGVKFTGLKVAQNADEVVMRDAHGKLVRIASNDLDSVVVSKQSLMPDDAIRHVTFSQFFDLLAFLRDRSSQESLRGLVLEYWVVGPFPNDFKNAEAPEKDPVPTAVYEPKSGTKLTWQPRQADADGNLNLRELFPNEDVSAYALTHVYTPKKQTVTMHIASKGGLRLWLNGDLTLIERACDDIAADVELREGWNTILIRAGVANGQLGVRMRLHGEGLRVGLRPEN